ncbi:MAG: UbiA family prenyltransferase [Candidatus Altiarchaeota archaeon]|nr:UbiA family prenyltransferase [Candidatus Altiarchaeota archaeon]
MRKKNSLVVEFTKRFIKFYRVNEWLHILGLSMLGYFYSTKSPHNLFSILLLMLISSLYLAFGYSSNCILGKLGKKTSLSDVVISILPCLAGLIISYVVSFYIFISFLSGAIIAVLYSGPIVNFKGTPYISLLSNSSLFVFLLLFGIFMGGGYLGTETVLFLLVVFMLIIPFQIVHEIEHRNEDKKDGLKTTVNSLSLINARHIIFMSILLVCGIVLFMKINYAPPLFFAEVTILFCISLLSNIYSLSYNTRVALSCRKFMRLAGIVYGAVVLLLFIRNGI